MDCRTFSCLLRNSRKPVRDLRSLLPVLILVCMAATGADGEPQTATRQLAIPARSANAISGSEFARQTSGVSGAERQLAALEELKAGNIPDFVRNLKPVQLTYRPAGKAVIQATIWVMPDYLAIGSNQDFLRIPLTFPTAVAIARAFGGILPTRKIVDAVYAQADCRLKPESMRPGPSMRSSGYYLTHQEKIEAQRKQLGCSSDALVAGHKKDIVLTNRLLKDEGHIAIYGWHRSPDKPIQPLSTVHGARYADYSHGVRLVSQEMQVNGKMVSIFDVARDSKLAPLLTREGTLLRLKRLLGRN